MTTLFYLFICSLAAWFIGLFSGGGSNMMLVPLIAFAIDVKTIAPAISLGGLFGGLSRLRLFIKWTDWQIIRYSLPGMAVGAAIGGYLQTGITPQLLYGIIGCFLVLSPLMVKLGQTRAWFKPTNRSFFFIYIVNGFVSGLVGTGGVITNPFYLAYGVKKEVLIGTKSVNTFIGHIIKLFIYGTFGTLTLPSASYGAVLGLGAFIGTYAASHLVFKISDRRFNTYVQLFTVLSGIYFCYKALQL